MSMEKAKGGVVNVARAQRMKIPFLHGLYSVPGGVKPTFLKDIGNTVISPCTAQAENRKTRT